MILEIAIGAGVAVAALYGLRRRAQRKDAPPSKKKVEIEKKLAPQPTGPRGLRVGDVLLYGNSELWLAGCMSLDEEGFVARIFHAPGNDHAPWVLQLDEEARRIGLVDVSAEVPDGRVPESLPIGGMRLTLRKRGHAVIAVEGELLEEVARDVSERGEFVLLGGPGGRLCFVLDFEGGGRLAIAGEQLGRELFDLLPGGE